MDEYRKETILSFTQRGPLRTRREIRSEGCKGAYVYYIVIFDVCVFEVVAVLTFRRAAYRGHYHPYVYACTVVETRQTG